MKPRSGSLLLLLPCITGALGVTRSIFAPAFTPPDDSLKTLQLELLLGG
ncbi:MAG: hypothetical protein LAN18_09590 [Acidobacteriia bacterium]|nr:hypothetical protein [Terriglobia bacterium]